MQVNRFRNDLKYKNLNICLIETYSIRKVSEMIFVFNWVDLTTLEIHWLRMDLPGIWLAPLCALWFYKLCRLTGHFMLLVGPLGQVVSYRSDKELLLLFFRFIYFSSRCHLHFVSCSIASFCGLSYFIWFRCLSFNIFYWLQTYIYKQYDWAQTI